MKKLIKLFTAAILIMAMVFQPMGTLKINAASSGYEPAGFDFSGKIILIGDSTVCDYPESYTKNYDRYGWGMKIGDHFENITVENLAVGGLSSRTFYSYVNYTKLENDLAKGDYLFIQFGHNDECISLPDRCTYAKLDKDSLDAEGKNSEGKYSFEFFLRKYVDLARNRGAVPIFITPITCRGKKGEADYDKHIPYQEAMIELGQELNVPVIDMTSKTAEVYNNLYNSGKADETAKFHCKDINNIEALDNTHLSGAGAEMVASLLAPETKKLGLTLGDYLKVDSYTITFDGAGGQLYIDNADGEDSGSTVTTIVKKGNKCDKCPDALKSTKDGMVLIGFKRAGDSTLYVSGETKKDNEKNIFTFVPDKDTVFTAEWVPACKVGTAEHSWDSGKVTKEATDAEAGEKTYTCTACGKTKIEPIPVKEKKDDTTQQSTTQQPATQQSTTQQPAASSPQSSELSSFEATVEENYGATVLVKGLSTNNTNYRGKFDLKISKNTVIEKNAEKIDVSKLTKGTQVKVYYCGEVMESYPAQIDDVRKIEVIKEAPTNTVKTPSKPSLSSLKNIKGKKLVIKWKKVKNVKGYQVEWALNSKFTKGRKSKTLNKLTFTVKNLKKSKKYYVRVRAYTKDSKGKMVYGKWSSVKKIKINK